MNKTLSFIEISKIAEFRNGLNFGKENYGKGCPIIGVADFKTNFIPNYEKLEQVNPSGITLEEDFLKKGDILFVRSNGNKKLVGRSMFIDREIHALFSGFCIRARITNDVIDPLFLAYFTRTKQFKSSISAVAGTNINNLNQDILGEVKVPTFSKQIQNSIIAFLSSLDAKIQHNSNVNTELESLARTIFNYWFVQLDFPNGEGKPYKTSGGEMEWNEELKREIPKGWEVGSLKKLFEIQSGYPFESKDYQDEGDYKIITIKNVQDGFLDTNSTDFINTLPKNLPEYCKLKLGDLLISLTGNVGRVCVVTEDNLLLNQRVGVVIPRNQCLAFTYFTLQSDFIIKTLKKISTGSNQKNLSPIEAGEEKALLPDENIVKLFEKKTKPFFDMILKNQRENRELIKLRDFLLPMLMNGQVKVKSEAKEQLSMAAEPQVKYGK